MRQQSDPAVVRRRRRPGAAIGAVAIVGLMALAAVVWVVLGDDGPSGPPAITVTTAVVSEGSDVAAAYLTLDNAGGSDALVGVTTGAGTATIHRTVDKGGTETMGAAASVPIKGGATTKLTPGGTHVMIEPLQRPLQPGDQVTLTLQFERSAPMTVTASVVSYSAIAASLEPGGAAR